MALHKKIHQPFMVDNVQQSELTMTRGLFDMYQNKQLVDYKIHLADDQAIECHRNVLFIKCKFFSTFFMSGFEDSKLNEINLDHLDADCMQNIVYYIYCGQTSMNWEKMDLFVDAVAYLDVDGLMQECDKYIQWKLTPENAVFWYNKVQTHTLPCVRKRLEKEFVLDIMNTEDFMSLSIDCMKKLLMSEFIELHEDQVFNVAMTWWKENMTKDPELEIFSSVRTSYLSELTVTEYKDLLNSSSRTGTKGNDMMQQLPIDVEKDEESSQTEPPRNISKRKLVPLYQYTAISGEKMFKILCESKEGAERALRAWVCLEKVPNFVTFQSAICPLETHGFVVCGGIAGRCAMFNGISMTWSEMPSMLEARANHICVALDNKMYVIGGHHYEHQPGTLCLDLGDMTWEKLAPIPNETFITESCVAGDSTVFIIGIEGDIQIPGGNCIRTFYKLDVQGKRWDTVALPKGRSFPDPSLAYREGKVNVMCVKHKSHSGRYKVYVYCYNPQDNSWKELVKHIFPSRHDISTVSLYGTDLVVCLQPNIIWKYNFETSEWESVFHTLPLFELDNGCTSPHGLLWTYVAAPHLQ